MLVSLQHISKSIGGRKLYQDLSLTIQPGEKIGFIGRNGFGKTTLFGLIEGSDHDFDGQIERRRGLIVASTAQEHHGVGDILVLDYVLNALPEYATLHRIIEQYPATMGDDLVKISEYTDAVTRFGELGYYEIEQKALAELESFQIPPELTNRRLSQLSGGERRLVELTKVTLSNADLALIDEPTNHMDYVAKEVFIRWLEACTHTVVVITHDRDVLAGVDRIVELKSYGIQSYSGNYDAYLKQNGTATAKDINVYEQTQKRLVKLEKQIRDARSKKASWSGTADKTNPFMLLEKRLSKERDELTVTMKRPDFWIDQETISTLQDRVVEKYDTYKARNIRLRTGAEHRSRELIAVDGLSLGYTEPLFADLSFDLSVGERLRLHGRNGAGKSTLIKAILDQAAGRAPRTLRAGTILVDRKTTIGQYEQEIGSHYLDMPLSVAITRSYHDRGLEINETKVRQILADYLFDPREDGRLKLAQLSGGQKARFQLIAMLAAEPNLLILDEPTNHLDLPSIEELENALQRYNGAILYVSHDTYFSRNVGGEVIMLANDAIAADSTAS